MLLRRFHPLTFLLLAAGLVATLGVLGLRYRAEARSRAVELVLDDAQARSLASTAGIAYGDALHRFKAEGVTGVAVTEQTLADLQSGGAMRLDIPAPPSEGPDGSSPERPPAMELQARIDDPPTALRVAEYLSHLVRSATPAEKKLSSRELPAALRGPHLRFDGPDGRVVYVPGHLEEIRATPTGLDEGLIREIRQVGLEPIGRINNPLGLTPESLRWELQRIKSLGVTTVIFAGEEVLGYKGLVDDTAQAFRDLGLIYGSVEFGKQRGDELLSRKLMERLVRVHSIATTEMVRLTPQEAIERYVRAAVERNIRLNYVRLPTSVTPNTFEDAVAYVHKLSRQTADAGFGLASPVPLGPVVESALLERLLAALVALGVGAGTALLVAGLVPLTRGRQAVLALALALGCALAAASGIGLGQQLVALLAAIVFPTLGFVLFPQPVGAFEEHEHAAVRQRDGALIPAITEFAAISLVTLAGALLLAGTLSQLPFMIKVRSFEGIKAATVLPLLLVGWIYLTGMTGEYPSWPLERDAVTRRLQRFFSEPMRLWHTVAFVLGMAALALLVARSGNDPGIGVSDTELRFRALLDRVLGVRPRTKEFLFGHPFLLLALVMAAVPRWRRGALPLLLVGAIGQVGMLNSFCHLHSPLKLTLFRTFHGLWIGGVLGIILVWLWMRLPGVRGRPGERLRV